MHRLLAAFHCRALFPLSVSVQPAFADPEPADNARDTWALIGEF
jgi:hypothetical protein